MNRGILTFSIAVTLLFFQQFNNAIANELADDYFDIATNYFSAHNYTKSLEYLDDITKIEPHNIKANELRLKIQPVCPPVVVAKPAVTDEIVLSTEPVAKVETIEQKAPENFVVLNVPQADVEKMDYNSDYYNTMGQEFYKKKDLDTAIEYFYKSINLNPKNSQAYNNLAMCYWLKNNPNLAIRCFKMAHASNRNNSQPLVNLALLYKQLGNEKKEVYYLNQAICYNTNDYWAYYLLGDYYKSKSQYSKAITNYKNAVKINDKFSQAYLGLGMSFFETEDFNYAIIALKQYSDLNPTSDMALFLIARTNLVLGRYAEAKTNILKAIEIADSAEYQFELAKIEFYLEDYPNALIIFDNLQRASNSSEISNYAGLCNYKLKNMEAAITDYKRAIELNNQRPIYYYNLALCYKALGDMPNYSKYLGEATKINPINYQDFVDLSYIYYDSGSPTNAINVLSCAIAKYPTVKALYLSKLKIYESQNDNLNYNKTNSVINERFKIK